MYTRFGASILLVAWVGAASPQPVNPTGTWDVSVERQGRLAFTLLVANESTALAARLVSPAPQGHFAEVRRATIDVTGNTVVVRFVTDDPKPVTVTLTGTLRDDRIEGTVDFSAGGSARWTARRVSAALVSPLPEVTVVLNGSVRDLRARPGFLSGARVTVKNNTTSVSVETVTDAGGRFLVRGVSPGPYTIAIDMPGYGRLVDRRFCVVADKPARFDAGLGRDDGRPRVSPPDDPTRVPAPTSDASIGVLTASEIDDALAFGRRPAPVTPAALTQSRGLVRYRAALLFTPFTRVAMIAHAAAGSGRQLRPADITGPVVEKTTWVVGLPETHYLYSSDMSSPQFFASVSRIVIRPKNSKDPAADIQPVWKMYVNTECDVAALKPVLGHAVARPGFVAAFPTAVLEPGNIVVVSYSGSAFPLDYGIAMPVRAAERQIVLRPEHLREPK